MPVMDHAPVALGDTAPTGPVTVAVNDIVDPRVADTESAVTTTVGTAVPTVVTDPVIPAVEE